MRIAAFALALALMVAGSTQPGPALPGSITLSGSLSAADHHRVIERSFEVPAGARSLEVNLQFTGAERRTVIDLGLRDPEGLRGWSGGRTNHVIVSRLSATPGYLPGPLPPGRWSLLLGVPNIRAQSSDTYTVTVRISAEEDPGERPILRSGPGWFTGDLHAHSMHSDGRGRSATGQPTPVPVYRVLEEAADSGLDFIVVSDHNTASHWLDIDRLQPYFDRMLLLHGREITTYSGHANATGERRFSEFGLSSPSASPAEVLRPIADAGAFISINHPTSPNDESCMGCGWETPAEVLHQAIHGVEVVNGTARDGRLFGWPFWAALRNRGWRVAPVGGSDDHTPDDRADRMVGTPATVVWARELSETALVEGLRAGRTYVRVTGPGGPAIDLVAHADGVRTEMGGDLPATTRGPVTFTATVEGAPGQTLDWIDDGRVAESTPIHGPQAVLKRSRTLAAGQWTSIVVRDGAMPTAISNAIQAR